MTEQEEKQLMETVGNMLAYQERLSNGLKLATDSLIEMDKRVKRLEQDLKKRSLNPVILGADGLRAN